MMKYIPAILVLLFFISCSELPKSVELNNITIARDSFGVPHIMAKTDAEVAYGLAWAQCEDDFVTLQELMAACKGILGEIKGEEGVKADFGIKFMGLKAIAESKYEHEVTGDFKKYLESYVQGVNAYAKLHPKKVLLEDIFPISGEDVITGYLLGNVEISHAGKDLIAILDESIGKDLNTEVPKGSNAFAFSSKKTKDGKTYLAINSHQPLEGWYSWYEAHLISEEGMNILGGTFAGGICIFHGVNEHLGWAHTVNHADFSDVYKLEIHPENEDQYKFDGKWLTLEEVEYTSWVKLWGPIKIPVSRTIYKSKYGPTFKTENGVFAWRFMVAQTIKMAEQWYRMNKARNFSEFKAALEIRGLTSLNIVYADKSDTIYYLSNGRFPNRNPKYDWSNVLPGNNSKTLWDSTLIPLDSLPQVLNPSSGFVFNTNNTPYTSSDMGNNPKETPLNTTMGYQETGLENNRSLRFMELMKQYDSISYTDFKRIKYDQQYPERLMRPDMINLELILNLNPEKYPELKDAIQLLTEWDRKANLDSTVAPLFILTYNYLNEQRKFNKSNKRKAKITEEEAALAILEAQEELMKNFGKLEIPLASFQRHTRGDVNLPIGGGPDVLAAMYSKPYENGTYRASAGESYIALVQFGEDGVLIETINSYGSNANIGDPHSTSQMELFTQQKLKKMTLNKDEVLKNAVKIYHPLKVSN